MLLISSTSSQTFSSLATSRRHGNQLLCNETCCWSCVCSTLSKHVDCFVQLINSVAVLLINRLQLISAHWQLVATSFQIGRQTFDTWSQNTTIWMTTRSPPIGGARQNAAPFNFTISTDIQANSVCHYGWFCVKPWPNYAPLFRQYPFYALLCRTYLHFAADWKQLVKLYPAGLWGWLSPISVLTFVILA